MLSVKTVARRNVADLRIRAKRDVLYGRITEAECESVLVNLKMLEQSILAIKEKK